MEQRVVCSRDSSAKICLPGSGRIACRKLARLTKKIGVKHSLLIVALSGLKLAAFGKEDVRKQVDAMLPQFPPDGVLEGEQVSYLYVVVSRTFVNIGVDPNRVVARRIDH